MSSRKKRVSSTESAIKEKDVNVTSKRSKSGSSSARDQQEKKRINFIKACELVSLKAYLNYAERLQLTYIPICMDRRSCIHSSVKYAANIKVVPHNVINLIKIEMDTGMWCEALEVCILSITPIQYLSDVILKDIVEIMLSAPEDLSSGYTISHLIDKCQMVLSLHFSTHCPCLETNIRDVYINFLTSPMDKKEKTCTTREKFGSADGIVSFCLNRLEYELGAESEDGALLDKGDVIPEDMKQSIKGIFWQKEKFDIFEMLERTERINRLMAVLYSIIELLQFDLAVWQSIRNGGKKRIQLSGKKNLMACILWIDYKPTAYDPLNVSKVYLQILRIFSYFVHLDYPEEHIKTMSLWLNTVIEMFYIIDSKSNYDYPNVSHYCKLLINEFHKIITQLPPKSIVKILERIKPAFIRHQLSHLVCRTLLESDENETLKMLVDFLKNDKWNDFPKNETYTIDLENLNTKKVKINKLLKSLSLKCKNINRNSNDYTNIIYYPKFSNPDVDSEETDQRFILHLLYIAMQACLEAYSVQTFQETLQGLNERLTQDSPSDYPDLQVGTYSVSESFVKTYRYIFEMLKELILTIEKMETQDKLPEIRNIFKMLLN